MQINQEKLAAFQEQYKECLPHYEQIQANGISVLSNAINTTRIKIHSISSRIKALDSCLSKVRNKEYVDPLRQIRDIIGLRVVCLFLSDIDRVGNIINKYFDVIEVKDKTKESPHNEFGYMGMHFIVKLKNNGKLNMPFEIQVRTIAQDAWASVSHHLDCKTNSIQDDLKRDFHALSGLFYIADTHFSLIKTNKYCCDME